MAPISLIPTPNLNGNVSSTNETIDSVTTEQIHLESGRIGPAPQALDSEIYQRIYALYWTELNRDSRKALSPEFLEIAKGEIDYYNHLFLAGKISPEEKNNIENTLYNLLVAFHAEIQRLNSPTNNIDDANNEFRNALDEYYNVRRATGPNQRMLHCFAEDPDHDACSLAGVTRGTVIFSAIVSIIAISTPWFWVKYAYGLLSCNVTTMAGLAYFDKNFKKSTQIGSSIYDTSPRLMFMAPPQQQRMRRAGSDATDASVSDNGIASLDNGSSNELRDLLRARL